MALAPAPTLVPCAAPPPPGPPGGPGPGGGGARSTLRMYEAAEGQPKQRLLEPTADVDALVEQLFDGLA